MAEPSAAARSQAAAVFDALGDPTRRAVLEEVAASGPVTATELAQRFPVSRQAVVKHLTALAAAQLVTADRDGRDVRYRLTPDPLDGAAAWLNEVGGRWDARLARLRSTLAGS